jgi:hypothetical protein
MADYRDAPFRAVNLGLNLRDSSDKLGEGQWRRLNNVASPLEGTISTRDGRALEVATGGGALNTIKRIGDASLLIGADTSIYVNSLAVASGFSGNPLAPAPFRPSLSPAVWTYLGDSVRTGKIKEDGTFFAWGITRPAVPASILAPLAPGLLDSSVAGAIVYDWRYTYYSTATGAESNPSDVVSGISVVLKSGQVGVVASTDPQVNQIRIYRRGGTIIDKWRLSVTAANATAVVTDNNADSTIALNEALSLDNDVPFTSVSTSGVTIYGVPLPYIAGPFQGKYILACGDPNRPGYLYWTNAGGADGAAAANNVQVTSTREPLINVFLYGAQPFVWTRDNLYKIDFGVGTTTFQGRLTACGKGLATPWAFDVGPLVYFLSQDGIYQTNGDAAAESLTEETIRPIFQGETVDNFAPVDYAQGSKLRLAYSGLELHFFYQDTNGASQHLVYHTLYKRWHSTSSTDHTVRMGYHDENQASTRLLLGASNGSVYLSSPAYTTDNGAAITANARTGSGNMGIAQVLKEFGNVIIDADPGGGAITITPYLNSEATSLSAQTITNSTRAQFPLSLSDTYAYSLALDFAWQGAKTLYGGTILWRQDEEVLAHWECPETDHGLSGWQHARDAYICLRSTGDLTLTQTVDGTSFAYTLLSTNNQKRKVYVRLAATKGKVYQYAIDAAPGVAFRLYGDECEVRVKPWNTALSYKPVASPFVKLGGPMGTMGLTV